MTPFLQLILALGVLITAAKLGGLISARLGQPSVLGELLAGLLLGPTVVDLFGLPAFSDTHLPDSIQHLAEIGVVLLMFVAGMEIDLAQMARTGRVATFTGVGGVIAPVLLGGLTGLLFGFPGAGAWFIGIVLAATSVSISAQTLIELGMLRSREGIALLGAAVIDDVLVILVLSVFLALTGGAGGGLGGVVLIALRMVLYLAVALALAFWVLPWLAQLVSRLPVSEGVTTLAVVVVLLLAWSAEVIGGVAAITGAFIAGVGLGRSGLHAQIREGMHTLAYAFFVPVFFVSIGLQANARALSGNMAMFAVVLTLIAIISKIVGAGLGARAGGFATDEALRLGLGMVSRGEVGLIVASVGLDQGLVTPEVFTVVIIMVLVTTLVTPLMLRAAFAQKSEQQPTKPELRMESEDA
jgi:Kef-type K+ transport system membrane component KefB